VSWEQQAPAATFLIVESPTVAPGHWVAPVPLFPETGGMVSAEGIDAGAAVTASLEEEADESSPSLEPVAVEAGAGVTVSPELVAG